MWQSSSYNQHSWVWKALVQSCKCKWNTIMKCFSKVLGHNLLTWLFHCVGSQLERLWSLWSAPKISLCGCSCPANGGIWLSWWLRIALEEPALTFYSEVWCTWSLPVKYYIYNSAWNQLYFLSHWWTLHRIFKRAWFIVCKLKWKYQRFRLDQTSELTHNQNGYSTRN